MSFTLMHHKNGVATPIKLSIWDALKGAPPRRPAKPKPVSADQCVGQISTIVPEAPKVPEVSETSAPATLVECPCCNKVHPPKHHGEKPNDGKKSGKKKDKQGGGDNNSNKENLKEDDNNHSRSTRPDETYTAEDDETIIQMKADEKSWADILKAIGKESKSQLQAHWKDINPATAGDGDAQNGEQDTSKKKQNKGQDSKKGAASKDENKKNTGKDKPEKGILTSWSARYDQQKWIAAASKHFDLTGQRITPEMAKKIAEGG